MRHPQRKGDLTEIEHKQLAHIGGLFDDEFSRLCAKYITQMPPELHDVTKMFLGDRTSIYGSCCEDFTAYSTARKAK